MRTLFNSFNYFDGISLTRKDAEKCSHSGDCQKDVQEVLKKGYVQKQLNSIDSEKLKKELSEYGAWDDEQLENVQDNHERIIWIAAGNIIENLFENNK